MLNTLEYVAFLAILLSCYADVAISVASPSSFSSYGSRAPTENHSSSHANQHPYGHHPIVCGPNEVIDGCANGGCGIFNCTQLGTGGICIDLIEGACRTGPVRR
ncbi:unnamed protein product [Leptidea sinapis]|uniref:Uncharacterized protein n=1 Tax=Leptidea sinapis TaxID=189913 RepID=A0A5E4QSK0_9NEOP|nr:unnamed protein product [Leptidea sinapis]